MKKLFIVLVLLGAGVWGYNRANDNFSLSNISLKRWSPSKNPLLNTEQEIIDARHILDQPFTYLGKGRQSFIFESQDGKYVLKFIKCQRINVTNFYETVSLPRFLDKKRTANIYEKRDRLKRLFTSMSIAKNPLQEQTGVLFLHIEPVQEIQKTVRLIDKLGFSHTVDIDTVPFILQKKAQKVMPVLKKLLSKKRIVELNNRLNQLIDLFVKRASLGIVNPDASVFRHDNIGFVQDRAIYIDLGTFKRSKKSLSRKLLQHDLNKLRPIAKWLKKRDKALGADFELRLKTAAKTAFLPNSPQEGS